MYNEEVGSIEFNSINKNSMILQYYKINDFPVEKCKKYVDMYIQV